MSHSNYQEALLTAIKNGDRDAAAIALNNGAKPDERHGNWGESPLQLACREKQVDIVRLFLENGANPNLTDNALITPLMAVCFNDEPPSEESQLATETIAQLLLDKGADINDCTYAGRNALHYACAEALTGVVILLLKLGADPNACSDIHHETPLQLACGVEDTLEIVKALLENGADVEKMAARGFNALHYLCSGYGHVSYVDELCLAGADLERKTDRGETPTEVARSHGRKDIAIYLEDLLKK